MDPNAVTHGRQGNGENRKASFILTKLKYKNKTKDHKGKCVRVPKPE